MTAYRVPGKPSWTWDETGIYREVTTGAGESRRTVTQQLIDWCPKVTRYVVGKTVDGDTIRTRYTVRVGEQTQTFSQDDLRDARAWDNYHLAAGQGDKQIAGALADIVRLQGRDLGETLDCPVWAGDELVMPPDDLMPSGYQLTERETSAQLLGIAADNPKLALVLGMSYGAPYVAPLKRQAFVVHLPGTAGQGKTTGMWAAASLWGRPEVGGSLIPSWNVTANAPYARVGRLAVVPAFYDDLHAAGFTPDALRKLLFGLTQGGGRSRSDRNGEERPTRYWSGVLFSSGNMSVLGMLGTVGEVARRVVEIPSPIVSNAQTADAVQALAQQVYGTFRPVPIAAMRETVEWAERQLWPVIGADASGVSIGIMKCVALGLAGAWCLGGKELAAAAMEAAKEALARQVSEAIEAGATTGDKLLEAAKQLVVGSPYYPTRDERKAIPPERPKPLIHGFYEEPDLYVMTNYIGTIASLAGLNDAQVALRELRQSGHLITQPNANQLRRQLRDPATGARVGVYHLRLSDDGTVTSPTTPIESAFTSVTSDTSVSAGQGPETLTLAGSVTSDTSVSAGHSVAPGSGGSGDTGVTVPAPRAVTSGNAPTLAGTGDTGTGTAPTSVSRGGTSVSPGDRRIAAQRAALADQCQHLRAAFAKVEAFPDATPEDYEAAVKTFGAALDGLAFAGPPARVGQLLFEKLTAQYGSVPVLGTPPGQPVPSDQVVTMFNMLDRAAPVAAHPFVVGLDVNAQFLAAAVTTMLGTGEPIEGPAPDLNKAAGYVQLGAPVEVGPSSVVRAGAWLSNPMAHYLRERGADLVVTGGYHWPEGRRWLSLWCQRVRAARAALMGRPDLPSQMALRAVKLTYAAFLGGWMNSGEDRGNYNRTNTLRPDWMHAVHSTARANMLRALGKARPAPFATLADAAYFLVDDVMDPRGLTLSDQPGKWKAHRLGNANDQAAITVGGRLKVTTLAAEVERGSLGNVAKVIAALHAARSGQTGDE